MGFIFMQPKARCYKVRKSTESQAALDKLKSFLESALDEPVRFLVRFWGDQSTVLTYAELRRIIMDEDVPQDIMNDWFHDYSTILSERITPMWRDAMIAGYASNPAFEGTGFQFNSSEENVRRWMADRSAELVTNCCREQREAIRYLVAESVNHQMPPAELARYIRPTIGLTERQAAANLKYYENMKSQLSEDHPRMKPEAIERRAREASARYAERQQRYRAETIARTELAIAYHQGNDEAVRQAMAQNKMPQMKKVWSTSGDDKVCPACSALEGMEIGMDGDFSFTSGRHSMEVALPPAHPRCACAVMYVEEEKQETSEAEQPQQNFYDTKPEGETVANGDDSGIMEVGNSNATAMVMAHRPINAIERSAIINEAINADRPFYAKDLRRVYDTYGVKAMEGCYDVLIHGAPTFVEYEHKYILDSETLYYIISGRKDYKADDIRLLACSTGKADVKGNCVAQDLANMLGVRIYAPIDTLNIHPNGVLTVGERCLSENMGFKWFYPDR